MSLFRFDPPTEEEARAFLEWRRREEMYQAELHLDAIACQRRLQPVASPREKVELAAYNDALEDAKWGAP